MIKIFGSAATGFFKAIPTNKKEVKVSIKRVRRVIKTGNQKTKVMIFTYYNYAAGRSNKDELIIANRHLKAILKVVGVSVILIMPGSVLLLPFIIKRAKSTTKQESETR